MSILKFLTCVCLMVLGAHALVTERNYHDKILLGESDINDAFAGLNVVGNDNVITSYDLNQHYYHVEAECAKKRFVEWIDSDDPSPEISMEELDKFISNPNVTLAIYDCTFVYSQSLKEYCFADQILTYIMLVLDKATVITFFNEIEKPDDNDKDITLDELKGYLAKANIANKVTYCEDDVKNMLIEIGGNDQKISASEWEEYVTQEGLHDDFRICRTILDKSSCATTYDHACLVAELLDWTMNHFTERDCQATFAGFDKDNDGDIEAGEVKNGCPDCSEDDVKWFIKKMDRTKEKDGVILYSEFRAFALSHWVKIQMEKECGAKIQAQKDQVDCYIQEINVLVKEQYTEIYLHGSDLDMVMEFEALDVNDNGKIDLEEDLKAGKNWEDEAAKNFIAEFDGPDQDVYVSLEEFNEIIDEPHFVYAIFVCMDHILTEKPKRIDCYNTQLQETLLNILDKKTIKTFFDYYDENNNGRITIDEIIKRGVKDEDSKNFMEEMGMGDETVNFREFSWYVKQKRITAIFNDNNCGKKIPLLHTQVLEYHEKVFTEYDTQTLFGELDTDKDWELSERDCASHDPAKHQSLLTRLDREDDHDQTVNFVEFWLFLNTPIGKDPRKMQLERYCTILNEKQRDEMDCYLVRIWDVK